MRKLKLTKLLGTTPLFVVPLVACSCKKASFRPNAVINANLAPSEADLGPVTYKPSSLAPSAKKESKLNPGEFSGHFPGMGPYGYESDQDHAGYDGNNSDFTIQFDISTMSLKYINAHYLAYGKDDTPSYAIYDFLTDAYPNSPFTIQLYWIKWGAVFPDINDIFHDLVYGKDNDGSGIGVHKDSKGHSQLNLHPEYMKIHSETTWWQHRHTEWEWAINQPF